MFKDVIDDEKDEKENEDYAHSKAWMNAIYKIVFEMDRWLQKKTCNNSF